MSAEPRSKAKAAGPRTAYLVLGMHRSGTSAVTQLLALAGASLPANLMPGDEHNARGYFEPWKIAVFNDERLRAAGTTWDDVFAYPLRALPAADEAAWVERAAALFQAEFGRRAHPLMKDPRVTILLPVWRRALAARGVGIRAVVPVRHPLAVAGSLARRDKFPPQKSVLLWSAYMLAAEAYAQDLPCAVIGYDALLADWRAEVARIEAAHGAPLPRLTEAAGRSIDAFLSPELRHNAGEGGLSELGWAGEIAEAVYGWYAARAQSQSPDRGPLDWAAAELAGRAEEIGPLIAPGMSELADARPRLQIAEALVAALRTEMAQQRESLEAAWRTDQQRLEATQSRLEEAHALLAQVSLELDGALAES